MTTVLEETEEWFTLDDIVESDNEDTLYCISVDSPDKQFLIGEMGVPTHNTDEGKEEDALKGEAAMIIGSIARLGRAAGVHLCIATQRPDAKLIDGETKANLGARVCCGTVDSTASSMILGNGEGARIRPNPKGRIYVKIFSEGDHAQGFFAPHSWLDEYFDSQGLNPDGTPKQKEASRMQKLAELEDLEETDLDTKEGNRNHEIVADMRAAEARGEEYIPEESQESRPDLGGKSAKSKTYRHEDDWDGFMDELAELNEEDD